GLVVRPPGVEREGPAVLRRRGGRHGARSFGRAPGEQDDCDGDGSHRPSSIGNGARGRKSSAWLVQGFRRGSTCFFFSQFTHLRAISLVSPFSKGDVFSSRSGGPSD